MSPAKKAPKAPKAPDLREAMQKATAENVRALVVAADAYTSPSTWDGIGLTTLAAACGIDRKTWQRWRKAGPGSPGSAQVAIAVRVLVAWCELCATVGPASWGRGVSWYTAQRTHGAPSGTEAAREPWILTAYLLDRLRRPPVLDAGQAPPVTSSAPSAPGRDVEIVKCTECGKASHELPEHVEIVEGVCDDCYERVQSDLPLRDT